MKNQQFGLSQQERDHFASARNDRNVIVFAGALVVLALVLFGLLERVPT